LGVDAHFAEPGVMEKESKQFFFAKKEPRNFYPFGVRASPSRTPTSKSFLVLFYKKELLSSCPRPTP
jgi:hypothetical protein